MVLGRSAGIVLARVPVLARRAEHPVRDSERIVELVVQNAEVRVHDRQIDHAQLSVDWRYRGIGDAVSGHRDVLVVGDGCVNFRHLDALDARPVRDPACQLQQADVVVVDGRVVPGMFHYADHIIVVITPGDIRVVCPETDLEQTCRYEVPARQGQAVRRRQDPNRSDDRPTAEVFELEQQHGLIRGLGDGDDFTTDNVVDVVFIGARLKYAEG
uniref:Uncharacterized protein n=1 Tax=Anopheles atroparvus TaxID=41427 RepID=A0AAG5D8Y2_ANOAO